MNRGDDEAAVRGLAEDYYRAMVAGDEARLRALFDPRAPIAGNYEGAFQWLDMDAFVAEAGGLVGQHGSEACRIEAVRLDGDTAVVTVAGRYAGLWFVDQLAMVKALGGEAGRGERWLIAAKVFHVAG